MENDSKKHYCKIQNLNGDNFLLSVILTKEQLKSLQNALADQEDDANLELLGNLTVAIERDLNLISPARMNELNKK